MSCLRLVFDPPLARLTIDRPERRNAMSGPMWRAMAPLCAEIEARSDVAAVIVEGAGGHFCAGADIAEFDEAFADPQSARAYLGEMERALEALSRLDRPTIAKLEGSAIGGGLAIALACDVRWASEHVHLAIPPAKLGLIYGPAETRLLVAAIGPGAAKDLLFSGRRVDPEEAVRLGLVNRLLPARDLAAAVEAQAREWAALSGVSIRCAKKAVRAALASDTAQMRALAETAAASDDFREGRAAFKAKRAPRFAKGS